MNLIDRYVGHVGRHLPEKSREDLKREIRSLVEDTLEDRSKALNRPIDEAMTVQVLKEFGRPEKMAASYRPERYLISPRMFPVFWLVVKIVISVLFGITVVKIFFESGQPNANLAQFLFQALMDFAAGAMSALGNIVLVFAILQYFMPEISQELDQEDEWNPLDMEEIEETNQIKRVDQIFEITFSVIGLAIFNFFPELLIFNLAENGTWVLLPALSETFFTYLPWINLLWGAEIILSVVLLIQGHWQTASRWVSSVIKMLSVVLASIMLAGPSLVGLKPQELLTPGLGFTPESANTFVMVLEYVVKGILIFVIVVDGFGVVKHLSKLIGRKAGANG